MSQVLIKGWRRTVPATFAPLISDGPIIVLVLLVLSRMPGWLLHSLQCAGGVFLLYLAFGAWKTWREYDVKMAASTQSKQQTVLQAALVNLLNPNPYLGWSLVMGPLLLKAWRETPANGIALLVAFYGTMVASLMGMVLLFATAKNLVPRLSRALIGVSAIALACFGLYQLWLGAFVKW